MPSGFYFLISHARRGRDPGQHDGTRRSARGLGAGCWFTWFHILWVDGGYPVRHSRNGSRDVALSWRSRSLNAPTDALGSKVPPRRWVVERNFGWLMRQRRLVRDYETTEN